MFPMNLHKNPLTASLLSLLTLLLPEFTSKDFFNYCVFTFSLKHPQQCSFFMVVFVTETSIKHKAAPGHIAVLHEALDSSGGIYLKSPQMSLQILDASICLITVLLKRTQTENSLLSLKRMVK